MQMFDLKRQRCRLVNFALVSFFWLSVSNAQAMTVDLQSLQQLQGYHRILILDGNTLDKQVLHSLAQHNKAISERQIVWFWLEDSGIVDNYAGALSLQVKQQIAALLLGSKVRLIGKDGGTKYQSDSLDMAQLFVFIDSMPMRQQEIRTHSPN